MAGDSSGKPRFSVTARRKDAPKGSKDRIKIGAAWNGNYPGTFNASFREVKEIVLQDGTVIDPSQHWFDLRDWSIDDRGSRGTSAPETQRTQPGNGTPSNFGGDGSGREPPF